MAHAGKFNIGDRVNEKIHGQDGVIVDTKDVPTAFGYAVSYLVKFDTPTTIKKQDWYAGTSLELLSENHEHCTTSESDKAHRQCGCGLKYNRHGGKHQEYCNLYNPYG